MVSLRPRPVPGTNFKLWSEETGKIAKGLKYISRALVLTSVVEFGLGVKGLIESVKIANSERELASEKIHSNRLVSTQSLSVNHE